MRKKNKVLVIIISISVLSGLIAIFFDLNKKNDSKSNLGSQTGDLVSNETTPIAAVTPASTEDNNNEDQAQPTNTNTDNNSDMDPLPLSPTPEPKMDPVILAFAGDVNLDDNSTPVKKYDSENKDITKCLSEDLLKEMIDADIMMLNNEFAFSTRGTKTPNKSYTFRGDPSRVEILKKMGVDIVSLANNHALDYGQDALLDTFTTLDGADIDYVGAGENLERAKAPIYYTVNGKKIAYVAASRVVFAMNWYATDSRPGMVGTYDPTLILETIKEAKANSDFVIVYVHWGTERVDYPDKNQKTLAVKYIDAGADAVIGCHPHVMQGLEFYKGKPIAYSLSNFWFSRATVESALLKLHLDNDGEVKLQLLPVLAKNNYTYLITEENEKADYFDFIKKISFDIEIDEDGFISPAKE